MDGQEPELHRACRFHDVDAVRAVLASPVDDVNQMFEGRTPMDSLNPWGNLYMNPVDEWGPDIVTRVVEIMEVLVENGATLGRRMDPFRMACDRAPAAVVDAVCRLFPEEFDSKCLSRVLFNAVIHGSAPETIRCLVRHGADHGAEYDMSVQSIPYDCCLFPESCLFVAVARGDEEMTRALLDLGAYPFMKDSYGRDAEIWHTYRSSKPNPKSIICDLFACRRAFRALKDDLHKELTEYLSHPARLQRLGYFSLD